MRRAAIWLLVGLILGPILTDWVKLRITHKEWREISTQSVKVAEKCSLRNDLCLVSLYACEEEVRVISQEKIINTNRSMEVKNAPIAPRARLLASGRIKAPGQDAGTGGSGRSGVSDVDVD